jgi:glycosyltransferase involved in cell wall biosynthesis/2-polyprenyl-3-methyl-5-hydroxy-6-metoxy-1,4-benzoquinol methylase
MNHSQIDPDVNSKSWWEDYHANLWDANEGSAQTAHFMERLIGGLAPEDVRFLGGHPLEILDWGCAFGEGVKRLAEAFRRCRVAGLDFSQHAVEVARQRYPDLEFFQTADGQIPRAFDVIITSNCLEHFHNPMAIIRGQLASCRLLYVALVPFREDPLCEFHFARFDETSFPEQIGDFYRIQLKVVEVEPRFWVGQQLLAVYAAPAYLAGIGHEGRLAGERRKWDAYYASLELTEEEPAIDEFGAELGRLVAELLPNGGRILEAGCGGGHQSQSLAKTGRYELALMDFSSEALEHARRSFERSGITAEYHLNDVTEPGDAEFDLVFNAGVLEHYTFDEQVTMLRGMASRSRRYVLVLVPNRMCYWYWIWRLKTAGDGMWPYGKEVPMRDLADALRAAGLEPLGQFFGGAKWSENFIDGLAGLDPHLRDAILSVHRSPILPLWQRAYLIGAVACKPGAADVFTPASLQAIDWPRDGVADDQAAAALSDAIALAISQEHRMAELSAHGRVRERSHLERLAARDVELAKLAGLHADQERALRTLELTLSHTRREIAVWQDIVHARDQRIAELCNYSALLDSELKQVLASRTFRLAARLRRLRHRVAPPGTRRATLGRLALRVARKARQGPKAFAVAVARRAFQPGLQWRTTQALPARNMPRAHSTPRPADEPAQCAGVPGLVSVILPVYNQADLLADSIESVLKQTYSEFELIIVNDGSADAVEDVLRRFAGRPRVRILTQANQKLPKALSNGFEFARGEFWTWTSADNLMHPEQLARQVAFLRSHPDTAMVYADYVVIDDSGAPLGDPLFHPDYRHPPTSPEVHLPRDPRVINVVPNNFIGPCFLYRGWVGKLIGEYDPLQGIEDYDYWMRINNAFSIEHLGCEETLYSYRVHENSLTRQFQGSPMVDLRNALMDHERRRRVYEQLPWTLRTDRALQARLSGTELNPHRLTVWEEESPAQAPVHGPARTEPDGAAEESVKALYLVDAGTLPRLAQHGDHAGSVIAAWFESIESVYENRIEACRLADIAFTVNPAIARRLNLLGIPAFPVGEPAELVSLAIKFANNRCFYEQTRPAGLRSRTLPQVFRPSGVRRHVLVQVDNFDEGGMEKVVLGLLQGLGAHAIDVSLLVLGRQGPSAAEARRLGVKIVTLPAAHRDRHYRALLKERQVDLIAAHYSTYGAEIASGGGVPFVQVVHNSYVWLSDELIEAFRDADRFTSAYICVSPEVAYYSDCALGLSVEKMVTIPNGIDVQSLSASPTMSSSQLRKELNIDPGDLVYLSVGSIHGAKAQIPLVTAMKTVARANDRAKLLLVGSVVDPDCGARLKAQIDRLGLESVVIMVGPKSDIARYYSMADIFVLPSYWEGWSLALTEAVCAGLPVVATDVGGARELVTATGGHLVKPPFDSITELDGTAIGPVVHGEHPRYIADLAQAMIDAARNPSRRTVSARLIRWLDQRRAIDLHARVYHWLMQGGHPAAARAWCRPTPDQRGLDDFPPTSDMVERTHQEAGRSVSNRFDQAHSHSPVRGHLGDQGGSQSAGASVRVRGEARAGGAP